MNNNKLGGNNSRPSRINSETSSAHPPKGEYRVGYGRPPLNTRFKSGHSGNPKGRPKGSKSLQRRELSLFFLRENHVPVISISFRNRVFR
jgi:hypothetical protein